MPPAQNWCSGVSFDALRHRVYTVVDGLVVTAQQFWQHCQQASIPAQLPAEQTLQTIADDCQAALRQVDFGPWLAQLQGAWLAAEFGHPIVILRPSLGASLPSAAHDLLLPRIGAIDELAQMLKDLWAEFTSVP
ncbi:MAG: hypothetical protein HC805_05905 [Alkalinema sp. RL_2_19]|nr:hypothetical protein [Alkalinema sp. RL_2_19]